MQRRLEMIKPLQKLIMQKAKCVDDVTEHGIIVVFTRAYISG